MRGRTPENFFGFRSTHENSISSIQNDLSFPELCRIVDQNSSLIGRYYLQRFYGNPLPNSYQNLGKVEKRFWPYYSATLVTAINWTTLCIRQFKLQIALFLQYRKCFEDAFVIGDYTQAERYLIKIEKETCHSIWSLQSRMLLHEFKDSPEENKTFLSETNQTATGLFISSFAHYLSARAEKNVSVSRFDSDLNIALQKVKGENAEANTQLYHLRLNKFNYSNYSNLKDVLTFDSHNSIIDRYILLVEILKMCWAAENVDPVTKMLVNERINYLSNKFEDPTFDSVNSIATETPAYSESTKLDLSLYDMFTSGLYADCISRLSVRLRESPNVIEYHVLYVKCFLLSGRSIYFPSSTSCHQNSILEAMYDLLSRTVDPIEAQLNLQRLLKNLESFTIANGLHKFINDETKSDSRWTQFDNLAIAPNNPEIVTCFKTQEVQRRYLNKLLQLNGQSITVKFKMISIEPDFPEQLSFLDIPATTKQIERGKLLYSQEKYEEASVIWSGLIEDHATITPIHELALDYLFMGFVNLSKLNKAISLYVDTYIQSKFLISRIDVRSLQAKIRSNKFRNVESAIDLPLFYTFSDSDENEVHIAYERFLATLNVKKPSELRLNHLTDQSEKWLLFLRYTCSTDIFKHSIYIDGSKDGYSERINICQTLLSLDPINEVHYKNEIKELSDALIIQEGLQQLDESKIYVNESGLINFELKEFEGLYNRYRTIANIYKRANKDLLIIDGRRNRVRLASVENVADVLSKDQYSSDPLRDAFADIFDEITRKFLFSKFGISAYLSTRIRHGVLLGELRPIFEKYNLISQRDTNTGRYQPIDHWTRIYYYPQSETLKLIQNSLAHFSENIDTIILNLLSDSLQIRTDYENENGWFDYYFEDTELSLHAFAARGSKDFPEFVRRALEILWERTDRNLSDIRNKIHNEVKSRFNQAIESLTSSLQSGSLNSESAIFTNINTCLTETDNALNRIASWFNRSGRQTSDFNLDKVIDIVLENISHSYPKRRLKIVKRSMPDVTIKGELYMHFADLIRIFLDNALKHSDQAVDLIEVEILGERQDQNLIVTIVNSNSNNGNTGEMDDRGNSQANLKKLLTEGKSGFPKAYKIIKSDLKNEANSYTCSFDEDNRFTVRLQILLDNLIV